MPCARALRRRALPGLAPFGNKRIRNDRGIRASNRVSHASPAHCPRSACLRAPPRSFLDGVARRNPIRVRQRIMDRSGRLRCRHLDRGQRVAVMLMTVEHSWTYHPAQAKTLRVIFPDCLPDHPVVSHLIIVVKDDQLAESQVAGETRSPRAPHPPSGSRRRPRHRCNGRRWRRRTARSASARPPPCRRHWRTPVRAAPWWSRSRGRARIRDGPGLCEPSTRKFLICSMDIASYPARCRSE